MYSRCSFSGVWLLLAAWYKLFHFLTSRPMPHGTYSFVPVWDQLVCSPRSRSSLLLLLASFLLLSPFPILLTPLLVGPRRGLIPPNYQPQTPPFIFPQAPVSPRRAPAFVCFRMGSRATTPFPIVPTAASSGASFFDETAALPLPAEVFFAASEVEGGMSNPPPPPAYPPSPRRKVAQGKLVY